MEPISLSGAAFHSATRPGLADAGRTEPTGSAAQEVPTRAIADAYTPEEKPEAIGRYWPGRDENGNPKIYQDGPVQSPESAQEPEDEPDPDTPDSAEDAARPEKDAPDGKAKRCTVNTDQVDREIEKLKQERQELKRQLRSEMDETKTQAARQRLEQVERELSEKDNDAYRRQHAVYTLS